MVRKIKEKIENILTGFATNKKWKPKVGEGFYYALTYNYVGHLEKYDDTYNIARYLVEKGNCFKTRKEAEIACILYKIAYKLHNLNSVKAMVMSILS